MWRTLSHLVASACLILAISVLVPSRAESASEMHLRLTRSQPAKDTLLASPPTQICLWFSQSPRLRLSSITLTGPTGKVELGPVTMSPKDSTLLITQIVPELVSGNYQIAWRTAGDDGHVIRGTLPFAVRPE